MDTWRITGNIVAGSQVAKFCTTNWTGKKTMFKYKVKEVGVRRYLLHEGFVEVKSADTTVQVYGDT